MWLVKVCGQWAWLCPDATSRPFLIYNTAFITIDESGHLVNPAQFSSTRGTPIPVSIHVTGLLGAVLWLLSRQSNSASKLMSCQACFNEQIQSVCD